MDGGNSIELTTTQLDGKQNKQVSKISELKKKIPEEALKLFEGRK